MTQEKQAQQSPGKHETAAAGDLLSPWRDDFPGLKGRMNGNRLAYLDSASSAQKPQQVIAGMSAAMSDGYANIHRGLYEFSQVKTQQYEAVRSRICRFINGGSDKGIVFTRNATEAINLVAQSWGANCLGAGDEIILTEMEHHANIVPWSMICAQTGAVLKTIPVLADGTLDLDAFEGLLTEKTKLLALVHVSNALGTVNPVQKIIEIAKDFYPEMVVLVDGSQAVVHGPVDVAELGCDFYAFTGHKLYGPTGAGALWAKEELLQTMPPYQGGGDMIETVVFDQASTGSGARRCRISYKTPPARFEAGTPDFVAVIGLGAAIDYVQGIGMETIAAHEQALLEYMVAQLNVVDGLRFYGTAQEKVGIVSFTADWGHPSDIAMILDQCGVAVRTGHHCCMPLMQRFGVDGTVRASVGMYSDRTDIDALCAGLKKAKDMLG